MSRLPFDLLPDHATVGDDGQLMVGGVDVADLAAGRLVFHGNNKSMDELRAALTAQVGLVVVDSLDELDRLDALHREGLPVPRIQLRVTPGVEAHTHEFVRTGQEDSKFGFGLPSGAAETATPRMKPAP